MSDSKASQGSLKTIKTSSDGVGSNKENSKVSTKKEKGKVLQQKRNEALDRSGQKESQPVSEVKKDSFKKKSKSHISHAKTIDSSSKFTKLPLNSALKETVPSLHGQTMPMAEARTSNTNNTILSKIIASK